MSEDEMNIFRKHGHSPVPLSKFSFELKSPYAPSVDSNANVFTGAKATSTYASNCRNCGAPHSGRCCYCGTKY